MAKPRRALTTPRHLPSWLKLKTAIRWGVVAVFALVAALNGGFAERNYEQTTLDAGQPVDIGPMRFAPVSATGIRREGSVQVDVAIQGYCLNETDAPVLLSGALLDIGMSVFDPATKTPANMLSFRIGPWDKPSTFEGFNPLGHDVQCTLTATFLNDYVATDQVRLVTVPLVTQGYLLALEKGTTWAWDRNSGPTQYFLPLTWK